MDETGCNNLQNKYGHNAGERKIVGVDNVPRSECNSSDNRFTLPPITAATGEVMMCVIIFQSKQKEVPVRWQLGIDVQVQPENNEMGNLVFDEAATNHGPGKYLPGGATCIYNGKTIPCTTYVSESGGITADILVAVLTVLDELDVFPHDSRINPFMIIDGHPPRLDPKFLTYINNCDHQWKVCLGYRMRCLFGRLAIAKNKTERSRASGTGLRRVYSSTRETSIWSLKSCRKM